PDRRRAGHGDRAAQHLHLARQLQGLGPRLRRGVRVHGLSGGAHSLLDLLQGRDAARSGGSMSESESRGGDPTGFGRGAGPSPVGSMSKAWRGAAIAAVLVIIIVALTPYLWMILSSFKGRLEIQADKPVWTFTPTLENYRGVFLEKKYLP